MIVGKIEQLIKYTGLNPHIQTVIDYLEKVDINSLEPGKYVIDGDNVLLYREDYEPREEKDFYFEGHLKYADIQIALEGIEAIGYYPKEESDDVVMTMPYSIEKDLIKFDVKQFSQVRLSKDIFTLVFPEDLHMPKLRISESTKTKKAVFKIKVE